MTQNNQERIKAVDRYIDEQLSSKSFARVRLKRHDNVLVFEFVDRNILDEANIQIMSEEINSAIDRISDPRVVLDFANVEHLSSAALGAVITINNRVKKAGGRLVLANIDPQIREVFSITRLDRLFVIRDTPEEAIAAAQ